MSDETVIDVGHNELLERLINHCYGRMRDAKTVEQQKHWWDRMSAYIARRTPERVLEMEIEKGLI